MRGYLCLLSLWVIINICKARNQLKNLSAELWNRKIAGDQKENFDRNFEAAKELISNLGSDVFEETKQQPVLKYMQVARRGNRLSITPVTPN